MLRDQYKVARGFDYEHVPEILLFVCWLVGWLVGWLVDIFYHLIQILSSLYVAVPMVNEIF